jgi:hypothetical protein
MQPRTLRRLWFVGFWLLVPWPLSIFGDAFVPAVRYLILGVVAAAVAVTEGASGPVGGLVFLFLAMALLTTLACWLAAWLVSKLLIHSSAFAQRAVTFGGLGAALIFCLVCEPYATPFGRALTGGLLDVLS